MIGLLAAILALWHSIGKSFSDPKFRVLALFFGLTLLVGMVFYHFAEEWSWLDSLYFSVITLATVGYGDFAPTTPLAKIFTIVYLLVGISIFLGFVNVLAEKETELGKKRIQEHLEKAKKKQS